MTTGPGSKAPSAPGRPAADTPQRLVVGASGADTAEAMGATDTAVASAGDPSAGTSATMSATTTRPSGTEPDLVGATLSGRFTVTRKIGQGGMGAVYEATHTVLNRKFAIKVLLEKYARRESLVQRLEKEAKLASSLDNEHIIKITDFGTTEDGRTYAVMEYLEGESLAECLARETQLPEQRILRIASQAASALAAAHKEGIVHRDIKPENLFMVRRSEGDFVKVVDFGISKSLRASANGEDEEEQPRLTQTGMVLGTPLYMSPEQARGDDSLDHRVDIYALGVIMYETATGRVPFGGTNYLSVISQVLNEPPKSPRELRPELSEEFEAIVMRAMAKDRNDRYATAADLQADLTALIDDPTRSTERAKITGPRKRLARRDNMRAFAGVAFAAVILAAIVFVVIELMGGGGPDQKAHADAGVAVKAAVIDAAPLPPPIDAPPTPTLRVHVETQPPGAQITQDGDVVCETTPCDVDVLDKDHVVDIGAQLEGYEDKSAHYNPLEHHSEPHHKVTIKLKKLTPSSPPQLHRPPQGGGAGSAGKPGDPTKPPGSKTGELGGYPLSGSGH